MSSVRVSAAPPHRQAACATVSGRKITGTPGTGRPLGLSPDMTVAAPFREGTATTDSRPSQRTTSDRNPTKTLRVLQSACATTPTAAKSMTY